VPTALMALTADYFLQLLEKVLVSKGLQLAAED
jgi:ABC-type proline/glycine betaine transport system permease subunit